MANEKKQSVVGSGSLTGEKPSFHQEPFLKTPPPPPLTPEEKADAQQQVVRDAEADVKRLQEELRDAKARHLRATTDLSLAMEEEDRHGK